MTIEELTLIVVTILESVIIIYQYFEWSKLLDEYRCYRRNVWKIFIAKEVE